MFDWIILGCVFLFVVAAVSAMFVWINSTDPRIEKRLTSEDEDTPFDRDNLLLGDMTESLGAISSPSAEKKQALESELRHAGYYRPTAVVEYAALRAVLIGTPLVIGLLLAMIVEVPLVPWVLGGAVIVALLGYSIPRTYINYRARQRAFQISTGLPVAVDLLSLCLTGGQNLLTALDRVSRDLRNSFPVLADELRVVQKHAQMVGLEMALQNFSERTDVQEVKTLSLILTHSERLGTDIAKALLEFSASFRQTLRQRAEAHANRLSFWMLFPTILCLLVPALILFSAPLFHEFARARKEMSDSFKKDFQTLKNSQTKDGKIGTPE